MPQPASTATPSGAAVFTSISERESPMDSYDQTLHKIATDDGMPEPMDAGAADPPTS
jgi:hypothetical protein